MLPAFATIDEFIDRLPGGLDNDDLLRAQAAIDDASTVIRSFAGKTWCNDAGTAVDFGDLAQYHQDEIVRITISAARRAFTNPEGATEMTLGDTSIGLSDSSSDVYLTAAEKAAVRRAAGITAGITTIATTREDPVGISDLGTVASDGTVYVDVVGGESYPWIDDPADPFK